MSAIAYSLNFLLPKTAFDISGRWQWFLVLGILLIMLSALACARPSQTKVNSVYFLGWLLVVACGIEVIITSVTGQWVGLYLHLVASILFGVTGYMLLRHNSAETVTIILAMYFVVSGIFNIVAPLVMNIPDWGWHVWSGFITLIMGPVVLSNSPLTRTRSVAVIGWFVGIDFFFRGLAWAVFALTLRTA